MNPLCRRLLHALGGASATFLVIWLFLLLFGRSTMLRDPGTFWHVATGERMLASRQVIHRDPFSFTFADRPWVADQWLAECGMAAVHRIAGWDGLLLLTASLLAALYAWIAARLVHSGLHWLPTLLLLALVLLVGSPQFHVRPLIVTIALLGVTFAWLVDVDAGRKSSRQLWLLVPLFALWTNLHGGVLAGIATVALCAVGWTVMDTMGQRWGGSCTATPRSTWLATALPIALAAITLINPYGVALPREWLETLAMPLPRIIEEHAPLELLSPIGCATVLLAVGYLAALISVRPMRPRVTWLVPLAWFALAVLRVRNAPLFGVTAAIALADMLPYSRLGQWLTRRGMLAVPQGSVDKWGRHSCLPGPGKNARPTVSVLLPLAAIALATAVQLSGLQLPLIGRGWARFDSARWPVEMLPQLHEINRSAVDGDPIFNDLNFGGFLIYHAPRLRVFIDDRCSLYGADFLAAYDSARRNDPAQIDRWQRQYGFRYALVESGGPFDRYMADSSVWELIARTAPAALYQRSMGTTSTLH